MEASREFSRTPGRLSPCIDVSVLQKTRMSHFWDTHHSNVKGLSLKSQLRMRRNALSQAAYRRLLKWAICALELLLTGLLYHR